MIDAVSVPVSSDRPQVPGRPASTSPWWPRLALAGVLLLGAALRLWGIDRGGYGNAYFSAGVRSMLLSWHNFLFNAFDPAGFVSLDKPPLAFWVQVASAKLFGYSGPALILPQVLEGTAAIAVLYHLVRRRFGWTAGLLAGLFLAVTPVSVAMDRGTNTDSCLILVLLLAAWALTAAVEAGSRRWLAVAAGLVGLGFNVKMLEAFGVLPGFAAVYAAGAPLPWRRRLADLALAAAVLLAVSLSWCILYDATPAGARPFVGSSTHNSMLELAVVYNGLDRFVPRFRRPALREPGGQAGGVPVAAAGERARPAAAPALRPGGAVPAGPLRLVDPRLAGEAEWLLPLAFLGLAPLGRALLRRQPLDSSMLSRLLWTGWVGAYALVYSVAGGMFRPYYLLTIAPPLAALAGMGVADAWRQYCRRERTAALLPAALLATAAWQFYVSRGAAVGGRVGPPPIVFPGLARTAAGVDARTLQAALIVGTLVAAMALVAAQRIGLRHLRARALAAGALVAAVSAALIIPTTSALAGLRGGGFPPGAFAGGARTAEQPADPPGYTARGFAPGRAAPDEKLVRFLLANRGTERYLLATSNAMTAAPIIIATGLPVMAWGGFTGTDPILTPAALARLAATHQVRFAMIARPGRGMPQAGPMAPQADMARWVAAHGTLVPPSLWRTAPSNGPQASTPPPAEPTARVFRRGADMQLYDLAPGDRLRAAQ